MSGRHRQVPVPRTRPASRLAMTATAAAMVVQPFGAAPAAAAPVAPLPPPTPGQALPSLLDVTAAYNEQRSCDPVAQPGLEAYVRMVLQTYRQGRSGGVVRGCGLGSTSEHKEGRAFDWMVSVHVPEEKAAGDALTSWLTGKDSAGVVGGNARRLGVMYVIWNKRIWSVYRVSDGWRPYTGPNPHTDHVHTSFSWDGAKMRTSWWDRTATVDDDSGPCRVYAGQPAPVHTGHRHTSACPGGLPAAPVSSYPVVWPGQSGSTVKVAQSKLGMNADGVFGSGTRTRLMGWQRGQALPVTGVLDKPTWARLLPEQKTPTPSPTKPPTTPTTPPTTPNVPSPNVPDGSPSTALTTTLTPYLGSVLSPGARSDAAAALQRALGVPVDGVYGPSTVAVVTAFQRMAGLAPTGVVDPATWSAVERAAYPLLAYRTTVLRQGSKSGAVTVLQRALTVSTPGLVADGVFGAKTHAALQAVQRGAALVTTGVTDPATWAAVEARSYPMGRSLVPTPPPATPPATPPTSKPTTPAKPPTAPEPPGSAQTVATTTSVSAYKATTLRSGARGASVSALQRALGVGKVDGVFGPVTAKTVAAFQRSRSLPPTGVVDRRTWDAVELAAHPLLPYRSKVLRSGSTGPAVAALQRALGLKADGAFGPKTAAAVKAMQRKGNIASTGTVATLTWVTVEKLAYPLGRKRW